MSSKPSNWVSDSFLVLLVTLMRYAWFWPWFELARRFLSPDHQGPLLSAWQFVALPLVAFGLTRFVAGEVHVSDQNANPTNQAPPWRGRLLVAALGLLTIVAVLWWQLYAASYRWWDLGWLPVLGDRLIHWDLNQGIAAPIVAILILCALWLNGLADAVRAMTHDDVWGVLLNGIVALVLYVALVSGSTAGVPDTLLPQVILLFGAGMVALAFSSLKITVGLDRALGLGQRRVSASPVISRYWLISVTVTVLLLLGIGLGIAALVAPEQLARLLALLQLALSAIGRVIGSLLLIISYVLFIIAYFFARLLEPLIRRILAAIQESPLMDLVKLPEAVPALDEVIANPTVIPDSYRWLALALFALGMLLIFALAVRRLHTAAATEVEEVRESILTSDLLKAQLSSLWERWFGRRQGEPEPFLSLAGEEEMRRRIRTAYQQLLATATELGQGRRPGATPSEYQTELQLPVTEATPKLAALTAAYHHARYAPDSPTAEAASNAQAAWEQIQSQMAAQQQEKATPP